MTKTTFNTNEVVNSISNNSNVTTMRTINSNNNSERVNSVSNNSNVTAMTQVKNIAFTTFMKKVNAILAERFDEGKLIDRIVSKRLRGYAKGMKHLCGMTEINTEEIDVTDDVYDCIDWDIEEKDLNEYIEINCYEDEDPDEVREWLEEEVNDYDPYNSCLYQDIAVEFYKLLGYEINGYTVRYVVKNRVKALQDEAAVVKAVDHTVKQMMKDEFIMNCLSFDEKIESVHDSVELEFQYHPSIDMIKESMINHGITA